MSEKHSPTPWDYTKYANYFAVTDLAKSAIAIGVLFEADAKLIVTAVNSHAKLVEALAWYGEQARLARLIHSEGDEGRHAIANDGGKRAKAALAAAEGKQ